MYLAAFLLDFSVAIGLTSMPFFILGHLGGGPALSVAGEYRERGRLRIIPVRQNALRCDTPIWFFHTGDTSPNMEQDQRVTAAAAEFLKNRKSTEAPFLMVAGYLAPHFPLIVPEKLKNGGRFSLIVVTPGSAWGLHARTYFFA